MRWIRVIFDEENLRYLISDDTSMFREIQCPLGLVGSNPSPGVWVIGIVHIMLLTPEFSPELGVIRTHATIVRIRGRNYVDALGYSRFPIAIKDLLDLKGFELEYTPKHQFVFLSIMDIHLLNYSDMNI